MNVKYLFLAAIAGSVLASCSDDQIALYGSDAGDAAVADRAVSTVPDAASADADAQAVPGPPANLTVAPGDTAGTALVIFNAPTSGSAVTGYLVTATPGGISVAGASSPIRVTGLTPKTAYTFSVVALGASGSSTPATTGVLDFYDIVETWGEPMTQPNDTIFTGSFTFDETSRSVSHLTGSLTESMTEVDGGYGGPMTTVPLTHQLSSVPATLDGTDGLLVTTFALTTTDTFAEGGFAPGGTQYYGLLQQQANNHNAYAMIFVNLADPTASPSQAQLDKLAYADCTVGGMMMSSCMTGTSMAGYGRAGTMGGYPVSQVITRR